MSDEPRRRTSGAGLFLVLAAVGGSAIGVAGWHLRSSHGAALDTSGFDMSAAPGAGGSRAPGTASGLITAEPRQGSIGMVKGGAGMLVVPGAAAGQPPKAHKAPPEPKAAALTLKEVALQNEKIVDAFVRRMQAKHPSIAKYGKDWAASPELRALRDQYWKEKDPLKFAYGLAKSDDFGKLVKKYANDPGIRDVLLTGLKEAPASLMGAIGGVFQSDEVVKDLAATVIKAVGLPDSLVGTMLDGDAKAPDPDKVMSEIMDSAAKNGPPPEAPAGQKESDKPEEPAINNGFIPLSGKK